MEVYPTNPNQPQLPEGKPDRKKVKGAEIQKSKWTKILESMIDEDLPSLKKYVIMNVILPRIGKMLMDIFNIGSNGGSTTPIGTGNTNYNAISSEVRVIGSSTNTQAFKDQDISRQRYRFKLLGYSTEKEANDVLEQLRDDIRLYGRASLLSYYEYSDVSTEHTEANWGWKDLSTALVTWDVMSNSWVIRMPAVQYLG